MNNKLFRKGDIAVIVFAVLTALLFFVLRSQGGGKLTASITVNGQTVETVDLSSLDEEFTYIPEAEPGVVIKARNGEIWFETSDCPDKLCVKCGKLTKKGDMAVCLPARTVITVLGAEVDAVSY